MIFRLWMEDPLNSAEGLPLSTGLQNRACQFPGTRLLSDIAFVMRSSCRGYVPVHVIVADAMQELQVAEPVVLVVTVFMVDCCLLLHGEEQSAVPPSSALMLEEFSSGCVQSDVRSFSCAPVAPVAIIRADAFAQSSLSFDWGLYVPSQRTLFPDDIVRAPASWLEVFLYYPLGAFMRVPPFCPAEYLPP